MFLISHATHFTFKFSVDLLLTVNLQDPEDTLTREMIWCAHGRGARDISAAACAPTHSTQADPLH